MNCVATVRIDGGHFRSCITQPAAACKLPLPCCPVERSSAVGCRCLLGSADAFCIGIVYSVIHSITGEERRKRKRKEKKKRGNKIIGEEESE